MLQSTSDESESIESRALKGASFLSAAGAVAEDEGLADLGREAFTCCPDRERNY